MRQRIRAPATTIRMPASVAYRPAITPRAAKKKKPPMIRADPTTQAMNRVIRNAGGRSFQEDICGDGLAGGFFTRWILPSGGLGRIRGSGRGWRGGRSHR